MKERHLLRNTFLIGLAIVTILCVIIMDIYTYGSKYEGYNIYYNGAIMPLQIDHPQDITATRNTEINISNNFLIKEEYELYNHSQQEKTIQLKYPYLGYLSNKDEFMIEANGKSINYQINLQQFINQYQYSKENQLFERTLPHNINQIKQLLDNQPKKLSQQMKDLLKQEVYVYRFVDRQYPQDGTVCYLTVDIPKNQKVYCYNIDKNEDEIFEIMMDNGEYALTPMLISKEKIKDIHLTGYSDSNLNKESHEVKAKIDDEVNKETISPKIYDQFYHQELIYGPNRITHLDMWLSYIAFIFDLHFLKSLQYVKEKNWVNRSFDRINPSDPKTHEQYETLRRRALDYIG